MGVCVCLCVLDVCGLFGTGGRGSLCMSGGVVALLSYRRGFSQGESELRDWVGSA